LFNTDPVSVPGYTGAGYIIFDPLTGDGAYMPGGWMFVIMIKSIGAYLDENPSISFDWNVFFWATGGAATVIGALGFISVISFVGAAEGANVIIGVISFILGGFPL